MAAVEGQLGDSNTAAAPLLPGIITEADLSPAAQDYLEALARLALALGVDPPAPAPLAAAAAAALVRQLAAQDEAEQLYELVQSLEAQVSAASSVLESLKALQAQEDAKAPARTAQAAANRQAAQRMDSKAEEYRRRAAVRADQLRDLGFTEQLRHGALEARSTEVAAVEAECGAAAQELTKYAGLPPDLVAAKTVHAELQARLQQLRAKVAEGLQVLE